MTSQNYNLMIDGKITVKGSAQAMRSELKKVRKSGLGRDRAFVGISHSKQVGEKW